MWGNTLGWLISLFMVLAGAGTLAWIDHQIEAVTPRSSFSDEPSHGAKIELPLAPETVLLASDSSDAAPIYQKALDQFQSRAEVYEEFSRVGRARDIESIPAIHTLEEAATHSKATLFWDRLPDLITYAPRPRLDALKTLALCARRAGQLTREENPAEAQKLFEAEFALGARLYDERINYAEIDTGLTLLAEAAGMLSTLNSSAAADEAQRALHFDAARKSYVSARLMPMENVVGSIDPGMITAYAGDVFYFAEHAQDRLWRVESIMALGRYRYFAAKLGDQRFAVRLLDRLQADSDPIIAAAATAARNLTVEQYRMIK